MTKEKFELLAQLRIQEREIKAQIEPLVKEVMAEVLESGKDKVVLEGVGHFKLSEKRVWTYPDFIVAAEEGLKKTKTDAQRTGEAKHSIQYSLIFKSLKEKEGFDEE